MFEGMIDPIIERCRPHALTLRDQATMFATGVIERLDRIEGALTNDLDEYNRHMPRFNLAAAVPFMVGEVPPGEEWTLEYWTVSTANANSILFIYDVYTSVTADLFGNIPLGALATGVTPSQPVQESGKGIVFPAGSQITLFSPSSTARGMIQFRTRRKRPRNNNLAAGIRNPTPDRTDGPQEVQDTQRHVGSWHPGVPVFGPSARNGH